MIGQGAHTDGHDDDLCLDLYLGPSPSLGSYFFYAPASQTRLFTDYLLTISKPDANVRRSKQNDKLLM